MAALIGAAHFISLSPHSTPMVSNKAKYSIIILIVLSGCASFYQLNYEFNKNFEEGNIEEAASVLDQNKKAARSKTRFLYYANQGVVDHLLGNYEESNNWLEKAYLFGEDYQKNYVNFATSYFLNPNLIVYPGEDHEHLMLLYYKALNYLKLGQFESALVECRRLNQRLYELGDKYVSENRYKEDAFIHNLMGIIYDASGDYNNAFIAYRNAYKIYRGSYSEMFNLRVPDQLKKDLLRTASLAGFPEELDMFSDSLNMEYKKLPPSPGGELVFFWHNGLAPVKDEWSINFVAVKGDGGQVLFVNEEMGLSFPFFYDAGSDGNASITDLTGTRVAFPKYVEREPFFQQASLEINNYYYPLEKAEDVNAIAQKTLNERMIEELGKGLLRVALKKSIEKQVRKEDETLGFLVGIVNFASEQADTRNWQTLPHSIHYTRVPLSEGENTITLHTEGSRGENQQTFTFIGEPGKTQFQTYQSLESNIAF
ncbi:COG3014 family protein [Ekhidna sp.]|uniref:COG3014 family protein n=1 Tax=Ekhidna sp. TaxID=2608089 RepID=UPI003CCBD1C4